MSPLQYLCVTNLPLFLGLPSAHFPVACLLLARAASPAKLDVNMEVRPLCRRVSHVEPGSLGFMSFLLTWPGASVLSVSYVNLGDD